MTVMSPGERYSLGLFLQAIFIFLVTFCPLLVTKLATENLLKRPKMGQKWPFFGVFKVKIEFLVKWPLILLKTFKVYKIKKKFWQNGWPRDQKLVYAIFTSSLME